MHTPAAIPPDAESLGISFDGRAYHYRDYSYDRLADALDYARLDRAKPGFQSDPTAHEWKQWPGPTPDELARMAEHGIGYANGRYSYGPYRYDVLDAALDYARREPGLARVGQPPERTADDPAG